MPTSARADVGIGPYGHIKILASQSAQQQGVILLLIAGSAGDQRNGALSAHDAAGHLGAGKLQIS